MIISDITSILDVYAPAQLQESYDNAGLITGQYDWNCSGVLLALDCTSAVIQEAIDQKCNLIIAHHPILFKGIKKLNGSDYVQEALILAIKNDIAIFACHTNLDNVIEGVNGRIAQKIGLTNTQILSPIANSLKKLQVFVPADFLSPLQEAIYAAGAGNIGNYSECGFVTEGTGSFKPIKNANPYTGEMGIRTTQPEMKLEVIFPHWAEKGIIKAMRTVHPYEEIACEISSLSNEYQEVGSGLIGDLPEPMSQLSFLKLLADIFKVPMIKHTQLTGKEIKKVAICGGAGSFLTKNAIKAGADIYVTADIKYHEFFDAEAQLVLADIGHYESEQYTIELFDDVLRQNFPNFAILKTRMNTNPVRYFMA